MMTANRSGDAFCSPTSRSRLTRLPPLTRSPLTPFVSPTRRFLSLDNFGCRFVPVSKNCEKRLVISSGLRKECQSEKINRLAARRDELLRQQKCLIQMKEARTILLNEKGHFHPGSFAEGALLELYGCLLTHPNAALLTELISAWLFVMMADLNFLSEEMDLTYVSEMKSFLASWPTLEAIRSKGTLVSKLAVSLSQSKCNFVELEVSIVPALMKKCQTELNEAVNDYSSLMKRADFVNYLEKLLAFPYGKRVGLGLPNSDNSHLSQENSFLRTVLYSASSLPLQMEKLFIEPAHSWSSAIVHYAISCSVWGKASHLVISHFSRVHGEDVIQSAGVDQIGHFVLAPCLNALSVRIFRDEWDTSSVNVLGVSASDKGFPHHSDGSLLPMTRTTHLMTQTLMKQLTSKAHSLLEQKDIDLPSIQSFLCKLIETNEFFYQWLCSRLENSLASWSFGKILGFIYLDLATVSSHEAQLSVLCSRIIDYLKVSGTNSHQKSAGICLAMSLKAMETVKKLEMLHEEMKTRFLTNFRVMCWKFWMQTFPQNAVWKKEFRVGGSGGEPSEYVTTAVLQLLYPCASSLMDMTESRQMDVLSSIVGIVLNEWEATIFRRKVRFSSSGANQLRKDVSFLKEWFKPDNISCLSSSVCVYIQNHREFRHWIAALHVLCSSKDLLRNAENRSPHVGSDGNGAGQPIGVDLADSAAHSKCETDWVQLKLKKKTLLECFSCSKRSAVATS